MGGRACVRESVKGREREKGHRGEWCRERHRMLDFAADPERQARCVSAGAPWSEEECRVVTKSSRRSCSDHTDTHAHTH